MVKVMLNIFLGFSHAQYWIMRAAAWQHYYVINKLIAFFHNISKKKLQLVRITIVGILLVLLYFFADYVVIPLVLSIYIIYFLLPVVVNCANPLISIKSFFSHGILVLTVLIICIYYLCAEIFSGYSYKKGISDYLFFCVALLFVWNVYSLIANCKVSQTLNAVFAAGIAAINLSISLVISVLPIEKKIFSVDDLNIISNLGFSGKSFLNLLLNLVLYPFLVTNLVATALTTLKRYWIDKYNNGEDITQEKIDELYHQKYDV